MSEKQKAPGVASGRLFQERVLSKPNETEVTKHRPNRRTAVPNDRAEQVLTPQATTPSEKPSRHQSSNALSDPSPRNLPLFTSKGRGGPSRRNNISAVLSGTTQTSVPPEVQPAAQTSNKRRPTSTSKKRERRGGWPSTRSLSWREVKQIDGIIHRLVEHGYPPTHLVTIMPSTGTPSEQKRACTRAIAHLGQALKRHGKPHIGLTIFEYPTNADHHVHHLVSAPPGEFATIARRHRPPEVHVKKIGDLPGMISYLTKERRRLSRDFEAKIERCWEGTRPLRGNRWR